jgi:hypothetical protein
MATTNDTTSSSTQPSAVGQGGQIHSNVFQQMLQILDDLTDHTHTATDTYTSVCECQCQCDCACGRGSI